MTRNLGRAALAVGAVLFVTQAGCNSGGGSSGGGSGSSGGGSTSQVLAEGDVGSTGGTVTGGGVTLEIPSGALSASTHIVIHTASGQTLPAGAAVVSQVIRFEPEGLTFTKPVRVTLDVDRSKISGTDDLVLLHSSDGKTKWAPIGGGASTSTKLSGLTTHFSWELVAQLVRSVFAQAGCFEPSVCSLACQPENTFPPTSCTGACSITGTMHAAGVTCAPASNGSFAIDCTCVNDPAHGLNAPTSVPFRLDGLATIFNPAQAIFIAATYCGWPCNPTSGSGGGSGQNGGGSGQSGGGSGQSGGGSGQSGGGSGQTGGGSGQTGGGQGGGAAGGQGGGAAGGQGGGAAGGQGGGAAGGQGGGTAGGAGGGSSSGGRILPLNAGTVYCCNTLVENNGKVYWNSGAQAYRIGVDGQGFEQVVPPSYPSGVAVAGGETYIIAQGAVNNSGSIMRWESDGGITTLLNGQPQTLYIASVGPLLTYAEAYYAGSVYLMDPNNVAGRTPLAQNLYYVDALASDGFSPVWSIGTSVATDPHLVFQPADAGGNVTLLLTSELPEYNHITHLFSTTTDVYLSAGLAAPPYDGGVYVVNKNVPHVMNPVMSGELPLGFAIEGSTVYWLARDKHVYKRDFVGQGAPVDLGRCGSGQTSGDSVNNLVLSGQYVVCGASDDGPWKLLK